jgi:hypothetical protein
MRGSRAWLVAGAAAPLFCALAIANSAGYRYGVSDLAFYLPAAFRDIDPLLFPRDGALLDVQARFTYADEAVAAVLRVGQAAGLGAPATIYAAHLGSLLLLFGAAVALGAEVFRSRWSVAAFVAALTLRHAVARSGVNTLEGYFHPRIVAFALCVLALAVFVRRGPWPALAIGLVACAIHTTTGFWLLIGVGVAGLRSDRRSRVPLAALGVLVAVLFGYAITLGPLAGRLDVMDPAWLAVIAEKDYLFPDRWPLDAWIVCAVYVVVIALGATLRARRGALTGRERGLVTGAAALLGVFILAVPLLVERSALAIQLQPARVFWLLDLLATVACIWTVEALARRAERAAAALAIVLVAASAGRGIYLMTVRFPERSLVPRESALTPWQDAMQWAQTTDRRSHWMAHPNHAFIYGSSVRVAGLRDVFVEGTKDPALAMYDRGVAMRVAERLPLVSDFESLTADAVLELARRYDLDFLVTEATLPFPVAFAHAPLKVYRIGPRAAGPAGLH